MSLPTHTVTASHVTTTSDIYGNSSESASTETVTGVLFAPAGLAEGSDNGEAALVGEATLYGSLPALDADDTVTHAGSCCDGSDFPLATWQVVGGSKGWGGGNKAVPIRRTGDV
jgi:hypothetical protein